MTIAIIAATGATGRELLAQALAGGHDVTAVVRTPSKLQPGVKFVQADLARPDRAALERAVAGSDAVISALGATSKAEAGVATRGTLAIVDAMRATGARRLIVLSAAPIGTVASPTRPHPPRHDPGDGPLMWPAIAIVKRILRRHYSDLATMEEAVRESGLDWTIVRPPQLTDKTGTGAYRVALGSNPRYGWKIARADVAHFMLAAAVEGNAVGQIVGIAN
jgi:putative NADH-flavin reductase